MPSTAGGLFIQVKLQTDQAERALKRLGKEFGRAVDPEKIIGDSSRVLLRELKTLEGGYKAIATASVAQARQTEAAAKVQVAQAQAATRVRMSELKVTQEQIRAESRLATVAAQDAAIRGRQSDARARAEQAKAARQQAGAVQAVARAQEREAKAQDALSRRQARQQEALRLKTLREQQRAVDDLRRAEERLAGVRGGSAGRVANAGAQELFVGLGAARSGNYFYGLAALARYFKNVSAASRDYARANQEAVARQNELRVAAQRYVAAGGDVASLSKDAQAALQGVAAVAPRAASGLAAAGGALGYVAIGAAVLLPLIVAIVAEVALLYVGLNKIAGPGVKVAASFELLRSQLIGLVGDAKAAAREYSFLLALGQTSLVPTEQLIASDRALISFGVTNQKIRSELVKFISDFGTATGATQVQLDNLAFALGQVASTGKVTAQDLRQFGNAGVNVALVVDQIAKNTGKSGEEIRAGLSAGTVSAEEFYKALIQVNNVRFAPAAAEAAKTVTGLFANLKDTIKTLLGETFRQLGVLDPIREFLLFLTGWVKANKDIFVPIAASVRDFFAALFGGATNEGSKFTGVANALAVVFRVLIPAAINLATRAIVVFRLTVQAVWPVIAAVIGAVIGVFRALVASVGQTADESKSGFSTFLQIVVAAVGGVIATIGILISTFLTMQAIVVGVFKAISAAVRLDFNGVTTALASIGTAIRNGFTAATTIVKTYVQAVRDAGNVKLPSTKKFGEQKGQGGIQTSKPQPDVDTKAAEEAAKRIAAARNDLFELTRSLFGQPSAALAGLYGDAGKFTATVDSIVSNATKLRDAIRQAAPGAAGKTIAALIDRETNRLIILAKRRERVTRDLEAAQDRLKKLIEARATLANDLRSSARSFVNSLSLSEETVTTFTRLDNVGSFITTEKRQKESYVKSLRDRLAEYRKFVAGIRALQKKGLDPALVRELIEAGPEAAGDAVAELAAAGPDTIAEVNSIQKELNSTADKFAKQQSSIYYDAGVKNAQAQVDGLKSKLAAIDAAAKQAAQAIIDAVKPYAKKASAAGADIASGLEDGLGSAGDIGGDWARDLTKNIEGGLDFSKISGGIGAALSKIQEQFRAPATQVSAGDLIQRIKDKFIGLGLWLLTAGPRLLAAGLTVIRNFIVDRVIPKIQEFLFKMRERLIEFGRWLRENGPRLVVNGLTFLRRFILDKLIPSPLEVINQIIETLRGLNKWLREEGPKRLREGTGAITRALLGAIPGYTAVSNALFGFFAAFRATFNQIVALWNRIDFRIEVEVPDWFRLLAPNPIALLAGRRYRSADLFPDVPYLSEGGVVTAPTLAMVGEKPGVKEAVIPLNRAGLEDAFGGGLGLGDVDVNVYLDGELVRGVARVEIQQNERTRAQRLTGGRR